MFSGRVFLQVGESELVPWWDHRKGAEGVTVWQKVDLSVSSVPERISAHIARTIDQGKVVPGEKLPSERAFITMFQASRISVRQALQDLEMRGYIVRIPRVGSVVASAESRAMAGAIFADMPRDHRTIREVMDLRMVVEPPIAQRAALRRREVELELLETPLGESERELNSRSPSPDVIYSCDLRFHHTIARLAHNPLLDKLIEGIQEWVVPSRQPAFQTERRIRQSVTAHQVIYEAIRDGDPHRASAAMHDHLHDVLKAIEPLTRAP